MSEVTCHYELKETKSGSLFRCHPQYRGAPWYDWATVEWEERRVLHETPVKVCLWMKPVSVDKDAFVEDGRVYGLVHPLKHVKTPAYDRLRAWGADRLDKHLKVVDFHNSVKSVAHVLPGVTPSEDISKDVHSNRFFLVLPHRSTWHSLAVTHQW